MNQFDGLVEFCAVATDGGFTRASKTLGVSTSFVSRKVAELEARLGVRLLHRTTRSVELTDIGARYYERATHILDEIGSLELDISEQQNLVKGRIRVTAGGLFGDTWVSSQLASFSALHPSVEIELDVTDRQVDLVREGFDLAIRHGMPSDPDLIVRRIGTRRIMVCASPNYLRTHGTPQHPSDLLEHSCLMGRRQPWVFRQDTNVFEVKVQSRWASNSGVALANACQNGLGIARLAENYFKSGIADMQFVPLLERFETDPQESVLTYPSRDRLPHRVRALISYLAGDDSAESAPT